MNQRAEEFLNLLLYKKKGGEAEAKPLYILTSSVKRQFSTHPSQHYILSLLCQFAKKKKCHASFLSAVLCLLQRLNIFISVSVAKCKVNPPTGRCHWKGWIKRVGWLLRPGLRERFLLHTRRFYHGFKGLHLSFANAKPDFFYSPKCVLTLGTDVC